MMGFVQKLMNCLRPTPSATADELAEGNPREQALARQLAKSLHCPVDDIRPSVAEELEIAPHDADDTILKRAKYHYQSNRSESPCYVWQDRKAG